MSTTERRRRLRRFRVLCAACRERKARFRYGGAVRADRDHTLCFECYRSELDRLRARRLGQQAFPLDRPALSEPVRNLDARQITHRQRMLEHMLETVAPTRNVGTSR